MHSKDLPPPFPRDNPKEKKHKYSLESISFIDTIEGVALKRRISVRSGNLGDTAGVGRFILGFARRSRQSMRTRPQWRISDMAFVESEGRRRQCTSSKSGGVGSIGRLHEPAGRFMSVRHQQGRPSNKCIVRHKERVVNELQKDELVGIDLLDRQSRDLGPSLVRIVAVLEVLGGDHQGRQKGPAAAVNDSIGLVGRRG